MKTEKPDRLPSGKDLAKPSSAEMRDAGLGRLMPWENAPQAGKPSPLGREISGVALLAAGFILLLSVLGVTHGQFVDGLLFFFKRLLGIGRLAVPLIFIYPGWLLLTSARPVSVWRVLLTEIALFSGLAAASAFYGDTVAMVEAGSSAGGVVGWGLSDPLIDLAAETTLRAMPTSLFSLLLETLRSVAKPLLVVGVILAMSLVGGGMAMLQPSLAEPMAPKRRAYRFVSMAIGIWLPLGLFVLLAEASGPNALTNRGLIQIALSSAIDAVIFTGALYLIFPVLRQAVDRQSTRVDSVDAGRRRLLALASFGVVAASAGYLGKLVLDIRLGAIGGRRAGIPAPVTSVGQFYVVSKNVLDPDVDRDGWALHVRGLVSQPLTLSYADLAGFPAVQQQTTLTCISNKIGGDLISNGDWAGVRLADLLARAGVSPDVRDVALYAADGYTESLPLPVAMDPDVLLAVQLDGKPPNRTHGAPARLVVLEFDGIKNVKWC